MNALSGPNPNSISDAALSEQIAKNQDENSTAAA
jgi:hypothetical protein